jgi:hypothetical protein
MHEAISEAYINERVVSLDISSRDLVKRGSRGFSTSREMFSEM